MSAPDLQPSPLDRPLAVTFFTSYAAAEKREERISLRAIAPRIKTTTHALKTKLPWLKLAQFGDARKHKDGVPVERQSLRHNENLLAISGIEADYDAEIVTVEAACGILRAARIAGMIYTSPSHTDDTPRWRVLCPLSRDYTPAARRSMVERLNGLFHGALAGESFTASQSYYFGSVKSNPSHQVELIDGDFIDSRTDLDEGAIGKPRTEYTPTTETTTRAPDKSRYVEAVIRTALSKVRGAADGSKHHTLRDQARLLGGYQHVGSFGTVEMAETLVAALPSSVLDRKAALTTALWGLEHGAESPITIPDLPARPAPEPPASDPQDPGYDADNVVMFRDYEPEDAPPPPSAASAHVPTDLPLIWFDDIETILDAKDFVQGVLVEQGSVVVYGESNAGKTFWTTDLALHVAAGKEWNGRRVEQGGVVYCVLEGGSGFRNRVAAWRDVTGQKDIPFAAIPASLNLLDPEADTAKLIAAIQGAAAKIGMPIKLVVVDTLSRAMAGGNENDSSDMGALVQNMDRIRAETGACVLFVHHSGKDQAKGARGHSLLRAAIDTEVEVVASETEDKAATIVKQRDMKKGDKFGFTLKVVELGTNRHGEIVTTCIVEPKECPETGQNGKRREKSLSPNAALGVRALNLAMGKKGAYLPQHAEYPSNTYAVSAGEWKAEFYQLKAGSSDTNKHAFSGAETALLAANVITARNGLVWFVKRSEGENSHVP